MANILQRDPPLHYQAVGQGEPIVLIHGLGANLAFWFMSIGRRLARDYQVICYDLRGHGASGMPQRDYRLPHMVQDLNDLLDYLKVDRAHIVGHSFGARVALAHAIANPTRVSTLTVADTQAKCLQGPTRLREWPHWPRWKQQLAEQGHRGLPEDDEIITFELLRHFNDISSTFTHGGLAKKKAAKKKKIARVNPSLKRRDMGRRGAARWDKLMSTTSASREFADEAPLSTSAIAQIHAPTLAMFGEFSHCLPTCRRLKQLIPDCEVSIVPEAGHFHPAVKPRRFIATLDHFLRKHTALPPG